jgi:hypothetical protein
VALIDDVLGAVRSSARAAVTIKSNVTPTIVIPDALGVNDPASSGAPQGFNFGDFVFRLLKPSVHVESSFGTFDFAPGGQPAEGKWALFASVGGVVSLAVLGLAGYGLYKLVQK